MCNRISVPQRSVLSQYFAVIFTLQRLSREKNLYNCVFANTSYVWMAKLLIILLKDTCVALLWFFTSNFYGILIPVVNNFNETKYTLST